MSPDAHAPPDRLRLWRRLPPALRGHPTAAALERHFAHPAPGGRTARHAAVCGECRAWLRWRAALATSARAMAADVAQIDTAGAPLAGALQRRAAGERVLLPAASAGDHPAASAPAAAAPTGARAADGTGVRARARTRAGMAACWATPGRWAVGAVAAGAALAATFLARPQPSAGAGTVAGELTFLPRAPRFGDTLLVVRYRPSGLLAGAPRLRLRATFHPDDDTWPWVRPAVTAAWLTPGAGDGSSDVYAGRVALPTGAAYARFAVEDAGAAVVDAHGRLPWDVVLADAAGRPRIPGVRSQAGVDPGAAWERARGLAVEATRLHPEHPSGWWVRTGQDLELVGSARADSVAAARRPLVARLDAALGRATVRESWAMLDLASFAEFAGLPAVQQRWHARLLAEAPRSVAAYSLRMQRLWAARTPPAAQLDSLERWWRADGDSLRLFLGQTVGLALAARDPAAALRWSDRTVRADPVTATFVAQQLVRDLARSPALAAAGVAYARAAVARLARPTTPGDRTTGDVDRPLDATAAVWDQDRVRQTRAALAVVGEGLLALGRPREAAAVLADATADGWNADAFRLLGEARLASGDTSHALGAFAYAAADPRLGRRLADSLGARLGARARDAGWDRAVADARRAMHARVLGATVAEVPRGDPRVGDADGRRRRLSDLRASRVTVVAMLNAHCGPVLADLPAVAQLRAGLAGRPVAFVAVTREAPGRDAPGAALRARGLAGPLWYDLDGEATAALDARGTPTYLVLDRSGVVRWRGHRIREASPVLDALLAPEAGS